jgi:FkbM family methyltransferase
MISQKFIVNLCSRIQKKIKRKGFFLEAGANDGIIQSNTYYLEKKLKWTGILIEPLAFKYNLLKNNRPLSRVFSLALTNDPSIKSLQMEILDGERGLMSKILGSQTIIENNSSKFSNVILNLIFRKNKKNIITVPAKTLSNLLDENSITSIDFISLDVEGYERYVLQGFDIKKYKPIAVLVEIWNSQFANIVNYFLKNNYLLVKNVSNFNLLKSPNWSGDHNDYLFIKKDYTNLI